jgi:hypothetical protein
MDEYQNLQRMFSLNAIFPALLKIYKISAKSEQVKKRFMISKMTLFNWNYLKMADWFI